MKQKIILLLIMGIFISLFAVTQTKRPQKQSKQNLSMEDTSSIVSKPLITFIELGSVNCIPCKAMQPVMKSIEGKYGHQIKIVFYDVWKKEQAHYSKEYNIRLIPTQVFLDASGKELMRHEGFYPEKEIDTFLQSKGLKPKS